MSTTDAKAMARKRAYALRRAARSPEAEAAAQGHLRDFLAAHRGRPLSGYLPILGEIDPCPVMAGWTGDVCVPVIAGGGLPLDFARWTPETPLVTGPLGTRAPGTLEPVTPEVMIVPLVGVDRWGHRLGNGGGYYDRTIARFRAGPGILAVGFAYAAQRLVAVPREPTDMRLDALVTEDGIVRFA